MNESQNTLFEFVSIKIVFADFKKYPNICLKKVCGRNGKDWKFMLTNTKLQKA